MIADGCLLKNTQPDRTEDVVRSVRNQSAKESAVLLPPCGWVSWLSVMPGFWSSSSFSLFTAVLHRLLTEGLVVKASTSRAGGSGFESR